MITAYEITATILNAYDDSIESKAYGIAEISKCNICGTVKVTVAFDGYAAQAKDKASSFSDIDIIVREAAFRALIGSGESAGCQLGQITYSSEIEGAYQGIALDYFDA